MADEEKVIEKSTEKAIENVTEAADAENTDAVAAEQEEVSVTDAEEGSVADDEEDNVTDAEEADVTETAKTAAYHVTDTSVKETEDKAAGLLTDKPEERPLDLIADRKVRSQPKDNIQRLKRIKQKKAQGAAAKYMAVAALTAVAVAVTAAAIGILGKNGEEAGGKMRVETVEASLETTAPPETEDQETVSIVLETTLSDEEIAEKEKEEAVTKVLDGYANPFAWARGSVGRAFGSHPKGRGFKSLRVQSLPPVKRWLTTKRLNIKHRESARYSACFVVRGLLIKMMRSHHHTYLPCTLRNRIRQYLFSVFYNQNQMITEQKH